MDPTTFAKPEAKKRIREIRSSINEAISASKPKEVKKLRRDVKRLKRQTRRLAAIKAPAPETPSGETGAATGAGS